MSKPPQPPTDLVTAFQAVQTGIQGDALALKLKMFFAGLLVNELTEWHRENIGETRGGDQKSAAAKIKNDSVSLLIGPWLEDQLGVTSRTCYRYRTFWRSIVESTLHADAVKHLNAWWVEHKPTLALPPATGKGKAAKDKLALAQQARQTLDLSTASSALATSLQELLSEADDLGLHELFEKPAKDVTPQEEEKLVEEQKDKQLELALQFWGPQGAIIKRLNRKDYLHLPKAEREALATSLEEALHEIKDTLKTSKR